MSETQTCVTSRRCDVDVGHDAKNSTSRMNRRKETQHSRMLAIRRTSQRWCCAMERCQLTNLHIEDMITLGVAPPQFTADGLMNLFRTRRFEVLKMPELKKIIIYIIVNILDPVHRWGPLRTTGRKQQLISGLNSFLDQCTNHQCPQHSSRLHSKSLDSCICIAIVDPPLSDADIIKLMKDSPGFYNKSCFQRTLRHLSSSLLKRFPTNAMLKFNLDNSTFNDIKTVSSHRQCSVVLSRFSSASMAFETIDHNFVVRVNNVHIPTRPSPVPNIGPKRKGAVIAEPLDISGALVVGLNQVSFAGSESSASLIVVELVQTVEIAELVAEVLAKEKIQKHSHKFEDAVQASSEDIEASNIVASLHCPLSMVRLSNPVKGKDCSHFQCFDAEFMLTYSKQIGMWQCPICLSPLPFCELRLDELFVEIMAGAPEDCVSVCISPNGSFEYIDPKEEKKKEAEQEERSAKRQWLSLGHAAVGVAAVGNPLNGVAREGLAASGPLPEAGSSFECPLLLE